MSYDQVFFAFHDINIDKSKPIKTKVGEGDVPGYLEALLFEIEKMSNRSRSFSLESENTEVFASLVRYLNEELSQEELSEIIAARLHRAEINAQKKIAHMQQLKKGSLVQVMLQEQELDELHFIVAKVEDNYFLDKKSLSKTVGLPYEDSTFKYARFVFSKDAGLVDITVYDANTKISDYWYQDFLELRESKTDEYNTKTAFNSIKQVLSRNVRKQSPQDYTILKNATINYFRSHERLSFEELCIDVFDRYKPEISELDMNKIREKIHDLPGKNKFDRSFNTVMTEIKARIVQRYEISDKIELKLKDSIDNLKDTIFSVEDPDGKKFIKVQVFNSETFESFNFRRLKAEE